MLIPDHETAVDFLNNEAIAQTILTLLKDNRQRALTIGVHGDWGAGKSSVLKMIEEGIGSDERVSCLWFNGWAFQGFDDAKTVFIEAIIAELCRQRSGMGKVKEIGARLIKRVDWLKLARRNSGLAINLMTGLPSPDQIDSLLNGLKGMADDAKSLSPKDVETRVAELSSYLKKAEDNNVPEQIHHFRTDFEALLSEAKIDQLIVLIDDLDRCLPETAINTLEAIKLFLFVPKTAFVIGADEAMIENAVRKHFPDMPLTSSSIPYARNYLEKLIQVPFRLPALGTQETKVYVTLLLLEGVVGTDHAGFKILLEKAREDMNKPWLGAGLSSTSIKEVDPKRQTELEATYSLAQQIGPVLAEGTRGNPRQIKRFLNALHVRQAIADARGFGGSVNQAVLAKLMLAERFQPDYYEHISGHSMVSEDGKVLELAALEQGINPKETSTTSKNRRPEDGGHAKPSDTEIAKWLEREWLQRWLKLEPALGDIDLRPYVFVAQDKRILGGSSELSRLENLIERLGGESLAARMVEPDVRVLSDRDAEHIFRALRERIHRHGNFKTEPPGFAGATLVATHHSRFQQELLDILSGLEPNHLGLWVVKGWGSCITEQAAKDDLKTLLVKWANQKDNLVLAKAAGKAVGPIMSGAK